MEEEEERVEEVSRASTIYCNCSPSVPGGLAPHITQVTRERKLVSDILGKSVVFEVIPWLLLAIARCWPGAWNIGFGDSL